MSGYERLKSREVSRLCHFTKLQNLTHILATEDGIIASGSIQQDTKNVNDIARYDGELDYVCCTIEYPNSWFLNSAIRSDIDKIFKDWVVLCIDLDILLVGEQSFVNATQVKHTASSFKMILKILIRFLQTEYLLFSGQEPLKCSHAVLQMVKLKCLSKIISPDGLLQE